MNDLVQPLVAFAIAAIVLFFVLLADGPVWAAVGFGTLAFIIETSPSRRGR